MISWIGYGKLMDQKNPKNLKSRVHVLERSLSMGQVQKWIGKELDWR